MYQTIVKVRKMMLVFYIAQVYPKVINQPNIMMMIIYDYIPKEDARCTRYSINLIQPQS